MTDRRTLLMIIGLLISVAALWFAMRDSDLSVILETASGLDLRWILLILLLYLLHFWLKAVRWQLILRPVTHIPITRCWPPMMIGFFANNILPAHLGEFVRVFAAARSFKLPATQILASLVLERLLDLLAVLGILGVLLISGSRLSETLTEIGYGILIVVIGGFIGAIAYALRTRFIMRIMGFALLVLPKRLRARIFAHLELGASGLSSILSPGLFTSILVVSVLHWLIMGVMIELAFVSIGYEIDLQIAFMVLVATVFAVTLPSSPGFFGSVQFAFVLATAPYAIEKEVSLTASIVYHLAVWMFVNVAGIMALNKLGMSWGELKSKSRD